MRRLGVASGQSLRVGTYFGVAERQFSWTGVFSMLMCRIVHGVQVVDTRVTQMARRGAYRSILVGVQRTFNDWKHQYFTERNLVTCTRSTTDASCIS